MIVSFLHVGENASLAKKMVESVRAAMPGVRILQMTDDKSEHVVDWVQVLPYDGERLMTYRMRHLSAVDDHMLTLDTDVIVQSDLSPVMLKKFDVALTVRSEPIYFNGKNITPIMPYNTGVMFSKCPAFWRNCLEMLESAPEATQRWWGDQLAVKAVVDTGSYRVLALPVGKYNYTPSSAEEDVTDKLVVHYKGPKRKEWMECRSTPTRTSS